LKLNTTPHPPTLPKNQQDTDKALNAVLDAIVDSVAGGSEVVIPGFGAFKPRARAARNGRNPKTGEALKIAARVSPAFVAGKTFRDTVAKGGK
jgi:nucleoid DNA-binding protein